MNNKYFIIDRSGKVWDIKKYRASSNCSQNMAICIDREALKVKGEEGQDNHKPEYLINANKLGFSWEENAPIGFIQYDYKANLIMRLVKEYARHLVYSLDMPIYEVSGSNFFDLNHPVVQSYAKLFGDRLFRFDSGKSRSVLSYDASYPQFNLASKYHLQEKHLPFAHFSISDCYRYEQSGECMLLFRNRRFNMPDIHPYLRDINQAWKVYFHLEQQIEKSFALAGRQYINVAKVSSLENWEKYQDNICQIAKEGNKEILVDIRLDKEKRYWIVDIDYSFIDKLGQIREIACIQIDIGNAKRLGIKYLQSNGEYAYPVIIHSAIPGGIERYIYMLIDDMKRFPIYFQPVQLRLIPVGEQFVEYAEEIAKKFPDIRIDIDDRAESVSKKIKSAYKELIPNYVVIGEKEVAEGKVPKSVLANVAEIRKEVAGLPSLQVSMPMLVSQAV